VKQKMDKKILIAIIVTFLVAGTLGFFGGTYYEKQIALKRFTQMRGNFQGRAPGMMRQQFNNNLNNLPIQSQPNLNPTN
jgi:hypothetical protein